MGKAILDGNEAKWKVKQSCAEFELMIQESVISTLAALFMESPIFYTKIPSVEPLDSIYCLINDKYVQIHHTV